MWPPKHSPSEEDINLNGIKLKYCNSHFETNDSYKLSGQF